jgi:hypothetical protein
VVLRLARSGEAGWDDFEEGDLPRGSILESDILDAAVALVERHAKRQKAQRDERHRDDLLRRLREGRI